MTLYRYRAVAASGEIVEGEHEADERAQVADRVHAMGCVLLHAEPAGALPARRRLAFGRAGRPAGGGAARDIPPLTRELATLLDAGLELDRALALMIDAASDPGRVALLQRVQAGLRGGASLSQAIETERGFSRYYVNLVRAGEASGMLARVLARLADDLEAREALRGRLVSALVYPAILVLVSLLSVLVLMIVVLPEFAALFDEMGATLPLLTRVVMATGTGLRDWAWLILPAAAAGAWFARRAWRDPDLRGRAERRLLDVPIAGDLVRGIEVARFARTLGTLLGNGVAVVPALGIVRDTAGNAAARAAVAAALESVRHGGRLCEPLLAAGVFPRQAVQLMRVGEDAGQLPQMLHRVADIHDREVEQTLRRLLAVLEPALVVALALVVGVIVTSLLLAVLGINDLPL